MHSRLEKGESIPSEHLKCGKRNLNQLLKNFTLKEKLHMMFHALPFNLVHKLFYKILHDIENEF